MNAQLKQRLSTLRVEMPPATGERHLERISVALREAPSPGAPRPTVGRLRHRVASVLAAVSLVLVPGAAIAAESAVPGDALYPVKRVTETVRSWFDVTVAADHRIDELEAVIDRREPADVISDRLRAAERAVAELDDPVVTDRFSRVRERTTDAPTEQPVTDVAPFDTAPPSEHDGAPVVEDERSIRDDESSTSSSTTTAPQRDGHPDTGATSDGDTQRHGGDRPSDEPTVDGASRGDTPSD